MKARWTPFVAALCVGLAGCTTSLEPEDEFDEPVEWKVFLNFGTMTATKDCDRDIGGINNSGEFAYELTYQVRDVNNNWQGHVIQKSRAYGNDEGDVVKLKSGEDFKLEAPNQDFLITEGEEYRIAFSAIEWDGDDRDERLSGGSQRQSEVVGTAGHGGFKEIDIKLGTDANCSVRLQGLTQEFPQNTSASGY